MKKIFFLIIIVLLLINSDIYAIKAYPNPITVNQADGTTLTIKLYGDEHFHYTTTEDGYLIRKDENGIFRYARFNNGVTELLGQKATNIQERTLAEKLVLGMLEKNPKLSSVFSESTSRKTRKISAASTASSQFPVTGSPRSLVILVNFSDKNFVTSNAKTAFTNLLNQSGYSSNGGTGSARDYFIESSFGKFSPQFDVVGPYKLPQNMAYYGENDSNDDDKNPQQLIIDACAAANTEVDFKQYDADSDGFVDNIFVYYAGNNEAEGAPANTIWPHRWSLADYNTKFDGKIIFDYACTSELRGSGGSTMCGIGTFCHEFGHVLGLADYYHTTDQNKLTLENWSIMDGGAYLNNGRTPPTYSSYDRFYLGWLKPLELKSPQNVTIQSLISANKAFLISKNGNHNLNGANPSPNEFYMLENRQKSGFDTYLPSSGLLIWHIDYDAGAWSNNEPNNYTGSFQTASSHMGVYLQPLSGSTTTPGSAFKSGSFYPKLWDGTDFNKPITAITESNGLIIFKFMGGNLTLNAPVANNATDIKAGSFVANWKAVNNAKRYYITAYSISDGESQITEGFDNGIMEAPIGWTITATGTTTSKNFSGNAIPALIFKNSNELIQTELYPEAVSSLSFYVRSINSTNSTVKLEGWNGSSWSSIDVITITSTLATTLTYNFAVEKNYTRFRFSFLQTSGYAALDDITVGFSKNITYERKNDWTENTADTLYNLVSGRKYFYNVIASDVAFYEDNTKVYEILSPVSNTISAETLPYSNSKLIRAEWDTRSNDMLLFLEDLNNNILIYNTSGQLVANIKPTDLKVNITSYLRHHNLYIISVGNKYAKIIY